jgi:hypothetical protein
MATITEVTDKWDIVDKFTDLHWLKISNKLSCFHGSTFYMVELPSPRTSFQGSKKTVPWLDEHVRYKNDEIHWCSDMKNGLYFFQDYEVALQFYLTFCSETFV